MGGLWGKRCMRFRLPDAVLLVILFGVWFVVVILVTFIHIYTYIYFLWSLSHRKGHRMSKRIIEARR